MTEEATVNPLVTKEPGASGDRPRFFTVAQAADLLGLSHSTLFRAIRAGEFPAIKVRGRYVVPAKAIDELESSAVSGGLVDAAAWRPRLAG
jgi:excisionase family DNA binding protein